MCWWQNVRTSSSVWLTSWTCAFPTLFRLKRTLDLLRLHWFWSTFSSEFNVLSMAEVRTITSINAVFVLPMSFNLHLRIIRLFCPFSPSFLVQTSLVSSLIGDYISQMRTRFLKSFNVLSFLFVCAFGWWSPMIWRNLVEKIFLIKVLSEIKLTDVPWWPVGTNYARLNVVNMPVIQHTF